MIFIKVIFLDIDGVLNTLDTYKRIRENYIKTKKYELEIDIERVEYLKKILDETNAKIVLSSSWRYFLKKENNLLIPKNKIIIELIKLFNKYGIEIYDITEKNEERKKGSGIKEWLLNNSVDSFIIIDDEISDLLEYEDNLIETRENDLIIGLCEKHIELSVNKLNKSNNLILKK